MRVSKQVLLCHQALCNTATLAAHPPMGAELGVENVVTILDQNLNYIDGDVYGTDLVRRLRGEFAWRGAILIQSANCETSDVREYLVPTALPPRLTVLQKHGGELG